MKTSTFLALLIGLSGVQLASAQQLKLSGMYIQWGYNREAYTRSTIHFKMSDGNNFYLHQATAHDKPDFPAIYKVPTQITIPQYNYRIGFWIDKAQTLGLELNFDHAKYVVTDGQVVHVTGVISDQQVDGDSVVNGAHFLHFEHTDGANWFHINLVRQVVLFQKKNGQGPLLTAMMKGGAGWNIPRTDFTWKGDRLNNKFHLAGYNFGVEGGLRIYPFKNWFFEWTGKTGYVRYINALVCTNHETGNRATHGFEYVETILTVGHTLHFHSSHTQGS